MSDNPRHKNAGQPPVSTHPAFPVIVALWFAALLGIGSMVLPIDLFERFAVASGLADLYQAAQPPLGATARIFVAIAAAAIGALAGIIVARRIAASNKPKTVTRRAAALRPADDDATPFAKRPISAHEELGAGGLDENVERTAIREPLTGRRRALAVTEESAPSEFLDFAPLPGQRAAAFDEPLDLVAFDAPEAEAIDSIEHVNAPDQPEEEPAIAVTCNEFGSAALSAPPSAFTVSTTAYGEVGAFNRRAEPAWTPDEVAMPPAVAPLAERALGELGVVELVERFALALQRHREEAEQPTQSIAADDDAPEVSAQAIESATPDRASDAEPATPFLSAIPPVLRPVGFWFDEDDDEDDSLPSLNLTAALSQGRGAFAAPHAEAAPDDQIAADEDHDDLAEVAEEEYTSLLAMKSPLGLSREPVRIEDDAAAEADQDGNEPVVIFPGQAARRASPATDGPSRDAGPAAAATGRPFDAPLARAQQAAAQATFSAPRAHNPADSGATERALRDALEKLQKMSGAA